jgi:hypothetical protein
VKLAFPVASQAGFLVNNRRLNSGGTTDFAFVPSLGRTRFYLIIGKAKRTLWLIKLR